MIESTMFSTSQLINSVSVVQDVLVFINDGTERTFSDD